MDIDLLIQQRKAGGEAYKHLGVYWERCKQVLSTPEAIEDGEVKAPVIDMTEGAVRALLEFDNRIEQQLAPLGDYFDIKAFARRGLEQAARLAALFAYFEGKGEVDAAMANQAIQVAQHSLDEWTRYSSGVVVSPLVTQAVHFMEWAQQPERANKWQRFTKRELAKGAPPSLRKSTKLRNEVLAVLVEHNHLLVDGNVFSINPALRAAAFAAFAVNPPKASNHAGYSENGGCGQSAVNCGQLRSNLEDLEKAAEKPHLTATRPQTQKAPKANSYAGYRKKAAEAAEAAAVKPKEVL